MSIPNSIEMAVGAVIVFFIASLAIVAGMIGLSALLGQHHKERLTDDPYEAGMIPTGSARIRFDVKFYRIAMFFVIFDLEAVFVYLWAVSARQLGWAGYVEICVFISLLLLALVYLWRVGALDWGTTRHRRGSE